jgi:hypothetical protein
MSKQFDELAKALASNTSRRSAIKMFLTGIGAVVGGIFLGRGSAKAAPKGKQSHEDKCRDHCNKHYEHEPDKFEKCCEKSDECNDDCCAILIGINSTQDLHVCVSVLGEV